MSVLDVGAGTGIASIQLAKAGAQVLAVEPDARMAAVARGKGVHLEESTFEDWQPDGRTFDLVVFAQSFHWVEPCAALEKVSQILAAGGRDRIQLRERLAARIDGAEVQAENNALAIYCTPNR
jgi:2-polyprenyl-3-methyl-5-hydroxy-6-metoxy-1,4-benzoquinol methylase